MANIDLSSSNDNYSASPNQETVVNALDGTDTLIVNWSVLDAPIRYEGGGIYTDDAFSYVQFANFELYDITGGSESDDLRGGDRNDKLTGGAGNDTLRSYLGADVLNGGDGTDTWIVDYGAINTKISVTLAAGGAVSTVAATGIKVRNVEALDIITGLANDTINTSAVAGNDRVETRGGDDSIRLGLGFDWVHAGDGTDTLVLDYSSLSADIKRVDLGYGWLRYQDGDKPTTSVDYYSVERFNITGGGGNDQFYGADSNDALRGGAGNDTLYGAAGVDTIDGGSGTDTWQFDYRGVVADVTVDIELAKQKASTGALVSNIEQLDAATGLGDDTIVCKSLVFNDRIDSGEGNDSITVGRGKDWLNAGNGDDLLVMDWSRATQAIAWSDLGYGWYRFVSGNGDQLDFYGVDRFNLSGGAGNDNLRSFGGNDTLLGNAGDDWLNSSSGLATIDGGKGTDFWQADLSANIKPVIINASAGQTAAQGKAAGLSISRIEGFNLNLGAGNDVIDNRAFATNDVVNPGSGNDSVFLGLGFDETNGGDGTDTLNVDYGTMTTPVTRIDEGYGWNRYTDSQGTAYVRFYSYEKFNVTGGSASDYLIGGGSNDTLVGNGGDDTLNGGASKDVIDGGAGNDRWISDYSSATSALKLVLNGAGNGTLTGIGTTVASIENINITTGLGNDFIDVSKLNGDDVVNTNDGNDTVRLGSGHDEANGGGGNDLLAFDFSSSTTSVVRQDLGYGWWQYADTAGSNAVRFYSFETFDITGGSGNDRLYGFGGDDVINGGAGNDVIGGGEGNDLLIGGAGRDIFVFGTSGNGIDIIRDAANGDTIRINGASLGGQVTLGDGASVGRGSVQLSFSEADDTSTLFIGVDDAAGADVTVKLTGAFAASTFTLSGKDIYLNAGSIDAGTKGNDKLLGTSGNDELTGGAGNDRLEGKAGNDVLDGGVGNDTLIGGSGVDVLIGGTGRDVFVFVDISESTTGTFFHDIIQDFNVAEGDRIDLSAIDADSERAGNQPFSFITSEFTNTAGELRYQQQDGLIMADVNGDGLTDFEIQVVGEPALNGANFVL
jgi:Ca2+-binding RTX toxin-like protein